MMLRFTNATMGRQDDPLYISKDWIVSVFEERVVEGGSLATVIYGGVKGESWYVQESLGEVVKIINGAK